MSDTAKKLLWAIFLSIAFMCLLLYGVDWTHFSRVAKRVNIIYMFIAFAILLLANVIRAFRFYTMDMNDGKKIIPWLIVNKVYNFLTATLPGGVGEATTAYVMKRLSILDILSALRILLLSRFMDLTAIAALLLYTVIRTKGINSYYEIALFFSITLLLMSIILVLPKTERFILNWTQQFRSNNKIMNLLHSKLKDLSNISEVYSSKNSLPVTMFQSALVIIGTAVSLYFILVSFDVGFSFLKSAYCFAIYAVLQMIPIQGIAGIGTQPARWIAALNLAGYHGTDIVALSIIIHSTFYIFISIMGIAAVAGWIFRAKFS